jgi:hypothetical protein
MTGNSVENGNGRVLGRILEYWNVYVLASEGGIEKDGGVWLGFNLEKLFFSWNNLIFSKVIMIARDVGKDLGDVLRRSYKHLNLPS